MTPLRLWLVLLLLFNFMKFFHVHCNVSLLCMYCIVYLPYAILLSDTSTHKRVSFQNSISPHMKVSYYINEKVKERNKKRKRDRTTKNWFSFALAHLHVWECLRKRILDAHTQQNSWAHRLQRPHWIFHGWESTTSINFQVSRLKNK